MTSLAAKCSFMYSSVGTANGRHATCSAVPLVQRPARAGVEMAAGWEETVVDQQQQLADLDSAVPTAQATERDAHMRSVQADSQLAHAQRLLAAHTGRDDSIASLAGVAACPVCKQAVGEEHKTLLHEQHESRTRQLSDEVWRCHATAESAKAQLAEKRQFLSALESNRASVHAALQARTPLQQMRQPLLELVLCPLILSPVTVAVL